MAASNISFTTLSGTCLFVYLRILLLEIIAFIVSICIPHFLISTYLSAAVTMRSALAITSCLFTFQSTSLENENVNEIIFPTIIVPLFNRFLFSADI